MSVDRSRPLSFSHNLLELVSSLRLRLALTGGSYRTTKPYSPTSATAHLLPSQLQPPAAPASPTRSARSASMVVPPLPVEIIEHIIKQSLPPLRFDTFEERYRLLRTFSLIDSRWRVLAQKELSRHLLFWSGQGRKFSNSPASRAKSLEHTKSLWSYSDAMALLVTVGGGLERCTGVEEVQLDCGVVEERFWASALHLRSLTGHCIDLNLPAAMPSFNRLSTLCLSDPLLGTGECAWSRFLNPTTLPSLRCLKLVRFDESDFVQGHQADLNDSNDIFTPLLSLAPQLRAFAIYEEDEQVIANRLSSTDWERFVELQNLTVGGLSTCFSTWTTNPKSIPPKLRTLAILDIDSDDDEQAALYENLRGVVVAWRGGNSRTIIIKYGSEVEDDADGAIGQARRSLLRLAEEGGDIFTEVLAKGFFDDWETFFDVW